MQRFDQHGLLDHLAEEGKPDRQLMVFASVIADLHRTAEIRTTAGYDAMSRIVDCERKPWLLSSSRPQASLKAGSVRR